MTRKKAVDLELAARKLKTYCETYKGYTQAIQAELDVANASQQEYDDEKEKIRQPDKNVEGSKSITRIKMKESQKSLKEAFFA